MSERLSRRKAMALRPETATAISDVLASVLATAAEKASAGDYLLTVNQLAERWSVSAMHVRQAIYDGKLECVQFGSAVRVRASVADEYARAHEGKWRRPIRRAS